MPRKSKDWSLEPETLARFLRLLDENSERAWSRYNRLQRRLSGYFLHNTSCDPGALADRTIDIVAHKYLGPATATADGNIPTVEGYAFRVARNVALEEQRRRRRETAAEMFFVNTAHRVFSRLASSGNPDHDCLEWAFNALPENQKQVSEEYFPDEPPDIGLPEHRKRVAKRLGISETALRKRVEEMKKELRSLYRLCCEKK
jgi:DNA-directed RNA polymerase specialized sigma24 family protein